MRKIVSVILMLIVVAVVALANLGQTQHRFWCGDEWKFPYVQDVFKSKDFKSGWAARIVITKKDAMSGPSDFQECWPTLQGRTAFAKTVEITKEQGENWAKTGKLELQMPTTGEWAGAEIFNSTTFAYQALPAIQAPPNTSEGLAAPGSLLSIVTLLVLGAFMLLRARRPRTA